MNYKKLTEPFLWTLYSKKLVSKIEKMRSRGQFSFQESEARDMRLVEGSAGSKDEGNWIRFYWLVDKEDGVIVDAKFRAYGQSALLGASEVVCELCVGKNYDQIKRITPALIDQQVRDRTDVPAFPPETAPYLNLALQAIKEAAEKCIDLPLPDAYVSIPAPALSGPATAQDYPTWDTLSTPQKIALIEEVLTQDIRPYIALDAGGVEVVKLEGVELHIAYQGACTSCYSSVGTTLAYIQQILRSKIHPLISVIPHS